MCGNAQPNGLLPSAFKHHYFSAALLTFPLNQRASYVNTEILSSRMQKVNSWRRREENERQESII